MKRYLTIDDLYNFYFQQGESLKFSVNDGASPVCVHMPAQFTINKENNDDSLMFCKVKIFHTLENRNHSSVTEAAAKKAMKTLAYKPILADFTDVTLDDGTVVKDFTYHAMEFEKDGSVKYIERQIGCFTADKAYMEVEEETGHNFVYGYCAIPREYTDACEIIERKNGTKVSVELSVNEMAYNAEEHILELTDITIMGCTCLGTDPNTGEQVEEGMKNARLDIADFSMDNNSIVNYSEQLLDVQEKLNTLLEHFNIKNTKEGGVIDMNHFEELLTKYNVSSEDVTFEYENMTDEELDARFEEVFGSTSVEDQGEPEAEPEAEVEPEAEQEPEAESEPEQEPETETETEPEQEPEAEFEAESEAEAEPEPEVKYTVSYGDMNKCFSVSMKEKMNALYTLVADTYSELDNEWYDIDVFEDDKIVEMYGLFNGKSYRQSYKVKNDVYSLVGDRVRIYSQWMTQDEINEFKKCKKKYDLMEEELNKYKYAELHAKKEKIVNSEEYSLIKDKKEFKDLVSNMDNYEVEDLSREADLLYAKFAKLTFATQRQEAAPMVFMASTSNDEDNMSKKPYGGIFEKYKNKKK